MGKKERHIQDLSELVDEFLRGGSLQELSGYLLANSSLPGRRANLELAEAFGDVVEIRAPAAGAPLWDLCLGLTKISADEAPVNTAGEFLPFCGTMGLGAVGSMCPELYGSAAKRLRRLASDPRWRMREAVCFGLQRLLAKRSSDTLEVLEDWVRGGNPFEMRATAAAVAEPALLLDEAFAARALVLHGAIFRRFPQIDDRRAEGFRVLRKGLGYTLSVVVCALPQEGFALIEQLILSHDGDVLWVVRQNLKKNRLVSSYPGEVERLQQLLG